MKKGFKIAIGITLALCGVAYALCYIFLTEKTTYFTECVIDFINKPLPIIGVSLVILLSFIFKAFVSSRFGKKALNEYKNELAETKTLLDERELKLNEKSKILEEQQREIERRLDTTDKYLVQLYQLQKNVKVKNIANEIKKEFAYGEETDSNTKI